MTDNSSSASGGIGFFGLLAIVFIALKILGKITWSWWWVLAPVWIPASVGVAILAIIAIIMISFKKRMR